MQAELLFLPVACNLLFAHAGFMKKTSLTNAGLYMENSTQATTRFYQREKLNVLVAPESTRNILWSLQAPLVVRRSHGVLHHGLVGTDRKGSVLKVVGWQREINSYSPYGYTSGALSMLGFNGEYLEWRFFYLLGAGYRAYGPELMRFFSPDRFSPFGIGGLNSYAYCSGEPINYIDPTGRGRSLFKRITMGESRKMRVAPQPTLSRPTRSVASSTEREPAMTISPGLPERQSVPLTKSGLESVIISNQNWINENPMSGNTRAELKPLAEQHRQKGQEIVEAQRALKYIRLGELKLT